MAESRRVILHYGGEKYQLPDSQADVLDDTDVSVPGTVKLNLGGDKWLTLATGPGIPIAVLNAPASSGRMVSFP